ncbi:MAG: hypothetical protein GTN86_09540 [Xanthomonadales bacterium]|nr:hypothetical protein [Xanthomonadales bacterium]NIN59718.1 hypothetical protein [Xanthomonadales bacterium]NIN75487.1 hypothetical protein [Xanthomonadales bacterium]NIO15176.1 hypothetical protein [Xanthomonadales bacterium]NIP12111.1 hypothetical protein [Xanthomonadales bacterium]
MAKLTGPHTDIRLKGHRTLFTALIALLLLDPLLHTLPALRWLVALVLVGLVLAAVRTVSARGFPFHAAAGLATIALIAQVTLLLVGSEWLELVRYLSYAAFLVLVIGLLLRDIVVRSSEVTFELILGAINVYLMAGVAFSFAHATLEWLQPGAYGGMEAAVGTADQLLPFTYFSFVTLTTLGYGDITPVNPMAATLSTLEAIFGQLYLAVLVARLVGLYVARSRA